MIPGMRKGNLQRIIVILFIGYIIFQFSDSFSLLNIPFLVKIGDKEHINNLFIYSFVIYNLFLYRKLIFLNKLKCEISKWLDDLQYYVYIGIFYVSVIYSNIDKFSLNEKIKIYLLLFIGLILGIIIFICFYENFSRENENKLLFPTRIKDMEYFKNLMNSIKSEAVMIEGRWGEGKTFFIDTFLKENKEKYIGIKIKASLFKDKEEIRKFIFREFEILLNNYNVRGNDIIKILEKIEFNKINYFNKFFKEEKLLEEDVEEVRRMFTLIKDKKIILILDDIERVPDIKERKEIISLLSEFEEYTELKKIILVNSEELKIEFSYLDKYIDIKFQLSNLKMNEVIEKIIPKLYWDDYMKVIESFENVLKGNRRLKDKEDEVYTEVKKIEKRLLTPRILKQINLEFFKYKLDELYNEEKHKAEIIEAFIIYQILKTYYQEFFLKLKEEDTLDIIIWRLKNIEKNNSPILDVFNILMSKNYIKQEYFQKFINHIEIISSKEKLKRESKEIFKIYNKTESWDRYIPNLKYKLQNDMKLIFLTVSEVETEKEEVECFYNNYNNILKYLYASKKLNIIEIVELLLDKYTYAYKYETINFFQENIEFPENMKNNHDLKQSFFDLDKLLLKNYKSLILLFFNKDINTMGIHNINQKKFNAIKNILGLDEKDSFDQILEKLNQARIDNQIEENEKKYKSLIGNLKFLSKIYDEYEQYKFKEIEKEIYSEEYTYEDFKKDEHELKEKMDIYQFKYLEKIKKI